MFNLFKYPANSPSEDLIPKFKLYESYLWRHKLWLQWRSPKTLYVGPFGTGVRYTRFRTIFDKYMNKSTLTFIQYSQNSIGRSGKWQTVEIFRCRLIFRVLMEIYRSFSLIIHSNHTDSTYPLLLFIGWLVTW